MSEPNIPPEAIEGLMQKAFVEWAVEPGLFWDAFLKSTLFIPISEKSEEGAIDWDNIGAWPKSWSLRVN